MCYLRLLGEPVGVPVVYVRQDVVDDGVPLGARVVDGGQLATVVGRQVRRQHVLVQGRHLGAVEEDLKKRKICLRTLIFNHCS